MDILFVNTSQDYDLELKNSSKIAFESYLALSKNARKYNSDLLFYFYKITKSIKQVKNRISNLY